MEVKAREPQAEQEQEYCYKCRANTPRLYRNEQGWLCAGCGPEKKTCNNEGCDFQDIGEEKRNKHRNLFCQRRTSCSYCNAVLQRGTQLQQHYTTCNKLTVIAAGSKFLVQQNNYWQRFLVETAVGRVICMCHYNTQYEFTMLVYAPMPCDELHLHRCEVQFECAGNTRTYTPDTLYCAWWDWKVNCKENNFLTNQHEVHVSLQLSKIE